MSDVYKIGVSLMFGGNGTAFLAGLSRQLLGVHAHAHDLEKKLNSIGRMKLAVGGGLAMVGGISLLTGLKHVTDHARELSHEMVQLKKLNIGDLGLSQVSKEARKVTDDIKGVKEVEALKAYGSAYSIFGHQDALKLMGPITQFAQVAGNTSDSYEKASNSVYEMIRAGDLLGKFVDHVTHKVDIDKLKHFLDLGAKVTLGTHGKVDAKTWLGLAQQGGPGMSGMSDKGLLTMSIAAQAMGGQRAGTALTSLYQQMVGGKMTNSTFEALMGIGLAGGHYVTGRGGKKKLVRGGVDLGLQEALKDDPIDAVRILKRQMEKYGYKDIEKQVPILFNILGRQTTQRIVHDLLRNLPQILGERERIANSMGIDRSKAAQDSEDYTQVEHNLKAAYENLMTDLAGPNAGTAIGIMNKITDALRSLTTVVRNIDPDVLKRLGIGLGILGVSLTAGGAMALIAAIGPVGWLTAGLVGLIGAWASVDGSGFKRAILAVRDSAAALYGAGSRFVTDHQVFQRLSMFWAFAQSEALILMNKLKEIDFSKGLEMVKTSWATTSQEFDAIKPYLEKALEWYRAVLGWRQKAQDAIMGFLSGFGGGKDDHPGMSESARQALADRKVDPIGVFVTSLIKHLNQLDRLLYEICQKVGDEIKSWPGRLMDAIKTMGSSIVSAIGDALRNAISNMFGGGASVTPGSFGGSGIDRSMIHNASWTALGGGAGGGGTALGSLGAGADYHAVVGGKSYRAAYASGGRERVGSWMDMLQRPVSEGGLGMGADKARAMVAMMQGESGINLNPGAVGAAGEHGTAQWLGPRRRALHALAARMGLPWTDLRVQQQMFRGEMLGNYRRVYDAIMAAPNGEHALALGIDRYESPAKKALAYRFRLPYLHSLRRKGAPAGETDDARPRPTVEPYKAKPETVVHTNVHLDGRRVALNTTRHQFNDANGPARGANFADPSLLYPQVA